MNETKPALLILAAGMGSRYGGLKQIDPVGPSGETILDYSVFDAIRAGFGRVVFVIRRDFEEQFREVIGKKFEGKVDVRFVFQQLDLLPDGFSVPADRQKPWGTGHAIWCAREELQDVNFGVINADDFYGEDSYAQMAGQLAAPQDPEQAPQFAMVGFRLANTLSEFGGVARGICRLDGNSHLLSVTEVTNIEKSNKGAFAMRTDGTREEYTGGEIVSMNFWGFTPAVFSFLEEQLHEFLRNKAGDAKAEFYIPVAVSRMVERRQASVRVLRSESAWFGVTYREDKARVEASVRHLIAEGKYPGSLWEK